MKWNGRYYRPGFGIPVYTKKEQSIEDLLKPLGEKKDKGNVWRPILNQPINVLKEDLVPSPTPTPTSTSTSTPTPTLTSTPTPTQSSTSTPTPTLTATQTPTLSETATPTPTLTSTPTLTPTLTSTSTSTPTPTLSSTSTPTPTLTSTPTPTPSATPGIFILDTYSATAAFSVRKLRSAYSGDSLRVRRSSDNAEQNIGFVSNELDTASLLSFVGTGATDNGFVTTFYDQTGNALHIDQSVAVNQPKIVNAGVLVGLTGTGSTRSSLLFDGTNDTLYSLAINLGIATNGVQVYSVGDNALWGQDGNVYLGAYNSLRWGNVLEANGSSVHTTVVITTSAVAGDKAINGQNWERTNNLLYNIKNGLNSSISCNGNRRNDGTQAPNIYYSGLTSEIIYFNTGVVGLTQPNTIQSNQNTYYQIY